MLKKILPLREKLAEKVLTLQFDSYRRNSEFVEITF